METNRTFANVTGKAQNTSHIVPFIFRYLVFSTIILGLIVGLFQMYAHPIIKEIVQKNYIEHFIIVFVFVTNAVVFALTIGKYGSWPSQLYTLVTGVPLLVYLAVSLINSAPEMAQLIVKLNNA